MKKKIYTVVRQIALAFLMLYAFNYFLSSLSIYIPINLVTVGIVTFLGIPGLSSLIILFFIVK